MWPVGTRPRPVQRFSVSFGVDVVAAAAAVETRRCCSRDDATTAAAHAAAVVAIAVGRGRLTADTDDATGTGNDGRSYERAVRAFPSWARDVRTPGH